MNADHKAESEGSFSGSVTVQGCAELPEQRVLWGTQWAGLLESTVLHSG